MYQAYLEEIKEIKEEEAKNQLLYKPGKALKPNQSQSQSKDVFMWAIFVREVTNGTAASEFISEKYKANELSLYRSYYK